MDILIIMAIFVDSALLTGVVRRYAESRAILDVPTDRSSHTVPTPRGGGVAIVFMVLLAVAWLAFDLRLPPRLGGGCTVRRWRAPLTLMGAGAELIGAGQCLKLLGFEVDAGARASRSSICAVDGERALTANCKLQTANCV